MQKVVPMIEDIYCQHVSQILIRKRSYVLGHVHCPDAGPGPQIENLEPLSGSTGQYGGSM